jgi:AcrR family transcriptional regulator
MSSSPTSTSQYEKQLAVLKAATSVFLTHGFSAATTDMIQRKAGVSKATMYAFYPSKEAIFLAMIERECTTMAESFKAIPIATGDIFTKLTGLGISYLQLVLSPSAVALFRIVAAETPRLPEVGRRFYLTGPKVVSEKIIACLTSAAESGEINIQSIGANVAASLFTSMVHSEGQLECLTHPESTPSAAQMDLWVNTAVKTFISAYGAPELYHSSKNK